MKLIKRQISDIEFNQQQETGMMDILPIFGDNDQVKYYMGMAETSELIATLIATDHVEMDEIYEHDEKDNAVYVHPVLFMDAVMWAKPTFRVWAYKILNDKLI